MRRQRPEQPAQQGDGRRPSRGLFVRADLRRDLLQALTDAAGGRNRYEHRADDVAQGGSSIPTSGHRYRDRKRVDEIPPGRQHPAQCACHRDQDGVVGRRSVLACRCPEPRGIGTSHRQSTSCSRLLDQRAGGGSRWPKTTAGRQGRTQQPPVHPNAAQCSQAALETLDGERVRGGPRPWEGHINDAGCHRAGSAVDQVRQHGEPADPISKYMVQDEHQRNPAIGKIRDEHGKPQRGGPGQRGRDHRMGGVQQCPLVSWSRACHRADVGANVEAVVVDPDGATATDRHPDQHLSQPGDSLDALGDQLPGTSKVEAGYLVE